MPRDAAETGRHALAALRRKMTERLVEAIEQRDPDLLGELDDVGAVRRAWIDDPDAGGPISDPPAEIVERLLERRLVRKPSLITSLGLSAIQLLSESRALPAGEAVTSERLAVMFTDLEGFTRFTAREGDEAAGEVLTAHHRAMEPIIRAREGKVVKRLGDGLLLTFREPGDAVVAGFELVSAEPGPLRLRAGAHLGDVMVLPDDVLGHTVNVAARVAELARGGELLVTDELRGSTDAVGFTRVRRRRLKGLDEPVGVCRAVAKARD